LDGDRIPELEAVDDDPAVVLDLELLVQMPLGYLHLDQVA
jgi:hypothetical protein